MVQNGYVDSESVWVRDKFLEVLQGASFQFAVSALNPLEASASSSTVSSVEDLFAAAEGSEDPSEAYSQFGERLLQVIFLDRFFTNAFKFLSGRRHLPSVRRSHVAPRQPIDGWPASEAAGASAVSGDRSLRQAAHRQGGGPQRGQWIHSCSLKFLFCL